MKWLIIAQIFKKSLFFLKVSTYMYIYHSIWIIKNKYSIEINCYQETGISNLRSPLSIVSWKIFLHLPYINNYY